MPNSRVYLCTSTAGTGNIYTTTTNGYALSTDNAAVNEGMIMSTPVGAQTFPGAAVTCSFFVPMMAGTVTLANPSAIKLIYAFGNMADGAVAPYSAPSFSKHAVMGTFAGFTLPASGAAAPTGSAVVMTSAPTPSAVAATPPMASPAAGNSTGSSGRYCDNAGICIDAIKSDTTVTFVVQCTKAGWAGIGIGSNVMAGSSIYVGYGSNSVTISQRVGVGHSAPSIASSPSFTTVAVPATNVTPMPGVKIAFAFSRPVADTTYPISTSGATNFIFAYSNTPPSDTTSTSASIVQHDGGSYGAFSLDLSKAGFVNGSSSNPFGSYDVNQMRLIHGCLMFIGWGVLPYIGIFIARYMKDRLGHMWYLLHMGIMLFGVGACTAGGLVCIELVTLSPRFFSSAGIHGIMGTLLALGIFPLQVILGFVANHMWRPDREGIPWWDQMHWWLGRLAAVGSIVILYLGLNLYGAPPLAYIGLFFWIGVCFIVLVAGQFSIGVRHHMKKKDVGVAYKL
ncbi:hypothetical protein HK101_001787 [Irineochytrium annulatum]|nr:hypothetical protein HK101_001787 [Irineochytrium annulatum]